MLIVNVELGNVLIIKLNNIIFFKLFDNVTKIVGESKRLFSISEHLLLNLGITDILLPFTQKLGSK